MSKFKLLSDVRKRCYGQKVFLYNPRTDNIVELNKLTWELILEFCDGESLSSLAAKNCQANRVTQRDLRAQLKEVKAELVKWEILQPN